MRRIVKLTALLMCLALTGYSQQLKNNVQFTDTDGREYDLYEVVESGKYVFCHFEDNT